MRATCLQGPWVVGDCWHWCPVVLSGAACSRGAEVRIVHMWCLSRASRMRRAALWGHRQCSQFKSSRV